MDKNVKTVMKVGAAYALVTYTFGGDTWTGIKRVFCVLVVIALVRSWIFPDPEVGPQGHEIGSQEWLDASSKRHEADMKDIQEATHRDNEFRAHISRGEPQREGLAWAKTVDIDDIAERLRWTAAPDSTINDVWSGCSDGNGMSCWELMKLSKLYHVD